ncbi:hypothetical protein U1839_19710 [Sphingomonas sp. RT2P30]|uniref:hypothetical protein n=1 Tax=Parasphingomonas halimpatiens TaxID=3096162 RepID=UPI002FC82D5E
MRGVILAMFALLLPAGEAPATITAPTTNFVIRLYNRVLGFHLPANFQPVPPQSNDRQFLMEIVPKGETVENWTRLITIRATHGIRPDLASAVIAKAVFDPVSCTQGHIYRNFGEKQIEGPLRLSVIAIGCGALPAGAYPAALTGAGEQDFILMFRDEDAIYTLNYAVRGAPFNADHPPIDLAQAEEILHAQFGTARVCASASESGCATIIAADTARSVNP